MKEFSCGDVVPGCTARFTGDVDGILGQVAAHAHADHGLSELPPALIGQVLAAIH